MCCDAHVNEEPVVGECPACGEPVDAEGYFVGESCGYSPVVCEACGDAPCDLSC